MENGVGKKDAEREGVHGKSEAGKGHGEFGRQGTYKGRVCRHEVAEEVCGGVGGRALFAKLKSGFF